MTEHFGEDVHNRTDKKEFRQKLRRAAEAELWKSLQRSKLDGRKFRRQHSVGPYILDFYCPEESLAIELDGDGHYDPIKQFHDADRRKFLKDKGIKILRFENFLVFRELEYVLDKIRSNFGWKKKDK
jgi:very-short-patch-repair endonuclease